MAARAPKRAVIAANDNHLLAAGPNSFPADRMTAKERMEELGSILAAGILRLRARRERRAGPAEDRLYSAAEESVCPFPMNGESQ